MSSTNPDSQWYALQTRPRFERLAARHLRGKGYEEYLPVHLSRRVWSDRSKTVELPLFPGYLFCRFNVHDRAPILIVPGVVSILGIGKVPTAISDGEITAIQTTAASGLHYGPWPFVLAGQRVVVNRGPLTGLSGVVIRVKSDLRLIVSVSLLQRSVFVEIDSESIETPELRIGTAHRQSIPS